MNFIFEHLSEIEKFSLDPVFVHGVNFIKDSQSLLLVKFTVLRLSFFFGSSKLEFFKKQLLTVFFNRFHCIQ